MDRLGRVLIVDDEETIRELLSRIARQGGYECVLAENGVQAVDVLSQERVDLILADLLMPGMSGLELLEHLKEPRIPVIMITGMADLRTAVEALHKGAADYLTKPVNSQELLLRMARALERHRLQQEAAQARELAAIMATTVTASHLINTPLAVIAGHIHLLRNQPDLDAAALREHLDRMQEQVDRIGEVLHRLQTVKIPAYVPYDKTAHMLDLDGQNPPVRNEEHGT